MRLPLFLLAASLLLVRPAVALDVPPVRGYVNDRADILAPVTEEKLEQFLRGFEQSDSTQIVILTIPTLEGDALEEYALKVAESWGVGQKGKDNGALLLIVRDDRKIRIEVGYGLEGRLTDLLAGRIVDNEIRPRFRAGDYDGGVLAGVKGIAEAVRGEYKGSERRRRGERTPWGALALLLFLGPGLLLFGGGRRSHHRRGGFYIGGPFGGGGGGGFGGGGFSGGGGGFGGGGASGGW